MSEQTTGNQGGAARAQEQGATASANRPPAPLRKATLAATLLALCLAACGDRHKDSQTSQTAVKVNKEEITVHQINELLSQQRGLAPRQAASASRGALDTLVDQTLAVEKAADLKIDREPSVVRQIEASRRNIIARAYFEKVGDGAPKPTAAEVDAYFEAHPELFSARRVYNIHELDIDATPQQVESIKATLASSKTFGEFTARIDADGVKYGSSQAFRAAEQLPLASVTEFAGLKEGQSLFKPMPTGAMVLNLVGSRTQPVSREQATPAIERYLLNERRLKLVADDLKALRASAKIEYVGQFTGDASAAVAAPEAAPLPPVSASLADTSPPATAAPDLAPAPAAVAASSMPDRSVVDKGLKGLK